jgi:glucan phosphoethanolaminetransferase (alkaline phosphatase superfamily)
MIPLTVLGWLDDLNPFKQVSEDITMLMLAFKIVVVLFLIQFLKERITSPLLMSLFLIACGYVMFFTSYSIVFQLFMVCVLALSFGFTQIMFDLSITKPWAKQPEAGNDQNFRGLY